METFTDKKKKRPHRFRLTKKRLILLTVTILTIILLTGLLFNHFMWDFKNRSYICNGLYYNAPCRNILGTPYIDIEVDGTTYWITTTPKPQSTSLP